MLHYIMIAYFSNIRRLLNSSGAHSAGNGVLMLQELSCYWLQYYFSIIYNILYVSSDTNLVSYLSSPSISIRQLAGIIPLITFTLVIGIEYQ